MPQHPLRSAATAAGATLLASTLGVIMLASPASARDQRPSPHTHFTMATDGSSGTTKPGAGIPNIDSVKSTIRTYHGATNPDTPGIANSVGTRTGPSSFPTRPTTCPEKEHEWTCSTTHGA